MREREGEPDRKTDGEGKKAQEETRIMKINGLIGVGE